MTRMTILLAALTAATVLSGCNNDKTSAPPPAATTAAPAKETAGTTTAVAAKVFDCGAKGQKLCPMQGWMKTVMTQASSSGEAGEIAKALSYVAQRPPPGYAEWTAVAQAGEAKAKAGDVDGAKAACKRCHDLYKERYQQEMRDRPF